MKIKNKYALYLPVLSGLALMMPFQARSDDYISSGVDTISGVIFSVDTNGTGDAFGVQIGSQFPNYNTPNLTPSNLAFFATSSSFVSNKNTTVNGTLGATGTATLSGTTNTIGAASTSTNTLQGVQNNIVGVQTTATTSASVSITGQNGSNAMVAPTNVATGQSSGVYIQGAASTTGAYDVYIASQNGQAAIAITNTGVQLISPTLSGSQTATNSLGSGGSNSGGTITNDIGGGSTGAGIVNNNFGQSFAGGGTVTNTIGGGLGTSTNSIGNTNTSTTVTMNAGNAASSLANGLATTSVTGSGGIGNSVLSNPTTVTSGNSAIVLKDASGTHVAVDQNGQMSTSVGTVSQTSASMTVTNGLGNVHGFYVDEKQATISGGITSSALTLNNNGATFSNAISGRPIQVHGVADGTSQFDAVNVQQLNALKQGIAGVAAMTNIPSLESGKNANFGIGVGSFGSESAFALGSNLRLSENLVFKASASYRTNSNDSNVNSTTWGLGAAYSW